MLLLDCGDLSVNRIVVFLKVLLSLDVFVHHSVCSFSNTCSISKKDQKTNRHSTFSSSKFQRTKNVPAFGVRVISNSKSFLMQMIVTSLATWTWITWTHLEALDTVSWQRTSVQAHLIRPYCSDQSNWVHICLHLSSRSTRSIGKYTPRKINMEHNHGGLEGHFPF